MHGRSDGKPTQDQADDTVAFGNTCFLAHCTAVGLLLAALILSAPVFPCNPSTGELDRCKLLKDITSKGQAIDRTAITPQINSPHEPSTMYAGTQPQHSQGPFAQDQPASSLPPPFDPNQPDQYHLQLPSTVFMSEYAAMSLPAQHDSSPSAMSAPSGSAFPPSFRFGSFSPEDGGNPSSSESLGFPMLSQQEQQPSGVLFGSIGPLGQLEPAPVPMHPAGQMELPYGPGPQGPSPVGQSPTAPSPVPVSGSAPGQISGAKHSVPKPDEPPVSSVQGSFSTARQPSVGIGTVSDASQASNALSLSPLPTRADSTVSTSSQGPSNPDGMHLPVCFLLSLSLGTMQGCGLMPHPALPCLAMPCPALIASAIDGFSASTHLAFVTHRLQTLCARCMTRVMYKCNVRSRHQVCM